MGKNKRGLKPAKTASELLDMYYLEARAHLLETAAILDRIERGQGGEKVLEDPRIKNLFKICHLLPRQKTNRAEELLNFLSV
ncbi:hypothetical protein [uncultured Desulfobacter sp.]|uniref:hypothetical protein n=1 Tax=uncultured Desulfobacter sp. TaxID=240139 RepID=UPI0029C7440D|nr:hypothetical protein [uncultured Desulfobacter sp.]